MAYCTRDEVAAEFKNLTFGASTSVTTTTAERFIAESDAEIDAVLGTRYSVPVSSSAACAPLLRRISIGLTAGRIKKIIETKSSTEAVNQAAQADTLEREARKLLKSIQNQEMALAGADAVTTHQGMKSYASDEGISHTFQKGVDQW